MTTFKNRKKRDMKTNPNWSGLTHKGVIKSSEGDFEFYLIANVDEDGILREIFIREKGDGHIHDPLCMVLSCLFQMDSDAIEPILGKLAHIRHEPSGWTEDPRIGRAKSLVDYLARWLAAEFLPKESAKRLGVRFEDEDDDN